MSRIKLKASTETVVLSHWAFLIWWTLILGVHVVTCGYNAFYSYCYWHLKDAFIYMYLNSLDIGMKAPYHEAIAIVHAAMSALHAVCILLMLGGSLWKCSFVFSPWSTCTVDTNSGESKSTRTESVVLKSFSKVYAKVSDRHGICGVNGVYFHAILIGREIVETALQTMQAYRMSKLLPRTLLNRFYVLLLVVNCWSSGIVHGLLFRHDEARKRFACIVLDCILDLVACMGVEMIILLSYVSEYNPKIQGFDDTIWYNDEWVARALNEFQMVVVVSWSDLASRTIFSLGLVMTTMNMKELLQHLPRGGRRVVATNGSYGTKEQVSSDKFDPVGPKISDMPVSKRKTLLRHLVKTKVNSRYGGCLLHTAHLLFGAWGVVVLGFHIYASVQPTLPQCFMQVRPWGVSRPACYLAGLDCHTLDISGKKEEVNDKWGEFDSSTVVQLLIRHCPSLEVPDVFGEFRQLRGIKVYNTTINEWGESAAFTNTLHPGLAALYIVRVNVSDGLLPAGFQSTDFPQELYDIEICGSNLRELPDDLDTKWPPAAIIQVEYSQLKNIPSVLWRLEPYYLAVTGNPITEIPPEVFQVPGMLYLGISEMNIQELPCNVTALSPDLWYIFMGETNISFFWSWVDELVTNRKGKPPPWLAERSTYCSDLEKLQNGSAEAFAVPMSPEYSQILTNSSKENLKVITKSVKCDISIEGLFYPITIEDSNNAISTPPPLLRP